MTLPVLFFEITDWVKSDICLTAAHAVPPSSSHACSPLTCLLSCSLLKVGRFFSVGVMTEVLRLTHWWMVVVCINET